MPNVSEVLYLAAELLSKGKWGRGYSENRPGTMCMMDAVDAAAQQIAIDNGNKGYKYAAYDMAEVVLYNKLSQPTTVWNDTVAKNKRQVISMLRSAAKAAEGTNS